MTETIDLEIAADEPRVRCTLALPPQTAPAPALIVVHEWWGLNGDIRAVTERFAEEGFVSLAVDLYGGRSTTEATVAAELSAAMKTADALRIVAAGIDFLKASSRTNTKVGIAGFCLGGAISIAAACHAESLGAAVPFYGTPRDEFADFTRTTVPLLGHFGRRDPVVAAERVELLAKRASDAGRRFDVCWYDAGHAFMRASDPHAYDEPSARLAWTRTLAFLREQLG